MLGRLIRATLIAGLPYRFSAPPDHVKVLSAGLLYGQSDRSLSCGSSGWIDTGSPAAHEVEQPEETSSNVMHLT